MNQDQLEPRAFKFGDLRDQRPAMRGVKKHAAAEVNYSSHRISNDTITLIEAERYVGVLQRLARRAFEQVIYGRDDDRLPCSFIHRAADVTERRVGDEFNLGHLSAVEDAHERRVFK